ncbi:hypothetical protein GCM10009730_03110 [Streptomyces albidochromogenes]
MSAAAAPGSSAPVAGNVTGDAATDLVVMGQQASGDGHITRSVLYKGGTTGLKAAGKLAGGYAGAVADVDKDGFGDIVTGNFMEKTTDEPNGGLGGALTVTYGSATGLSTRTPVRITQDTAGVPGTAEKGDRFGWSLSAGDTDRDGYADIAVGASSEALGSTRAAGTVTVLRGSATGLTGTGSKSFSQDTAGVPGAAESHDQFGGSVHLTDSTGDGRAELVAGAFAENDGAGAVCSSRPVRAESPPPVPRASARRPWVVPPVCRTSATASPTDPHARATGGAPHRPSGVRRPFGKLGPEAGGDGLPVLLRVGLPTVGERLHDADAPARNGVLVGGPGRGHGRGLVVHAHMQTAVVPRQHELGVTVGVHVSVGEQLGHREDDLVHRLGRLGGPRE